MASFVQKVSIYDYFKAGISVNEENVATFRVLYQDLSKINKFDGHDVNEIILDNTAEQLRIQIDSDIDRAILRACICHDDLEQVLNCLDLLLQNQQEPLSSNIPMTQTSSSPDDASKISSEGLQDEQVPIKLEEIECKMIVKNRTKEVDIFIQTFLLQVIPKGNTTVNRSPTNSEPFSNYNNKFLLDPDSTFALFIREQVRSLGTIRQRQSVRLRLVEPVSITDEFGTWFYDHFRGLFETELRSYSEKSFPPYWTLDNEAHIYCQFVIDGTEQDNETGTSSILAPPRTNSLEQFVNDVCAKEDNAQANSWLKALYAEDIITFAHLSNLKQTEWDNIKRLTMNARRILKAAVDRERESAADDRRRLFEESSPNQELPIITGNDPIVN